jgi:hypothetical protein
MLVQYSMPAEPNYKRSIQNELTANLKKQDTYTGLLCPGAKKRMFKAIELLIMSTAKKSFRHPDTGKKLYFHLNFITLTVAQTSRMIDGKEGHKNLLEPFLQWFRRIHGCKMYLWKAEFQERGQLHYHITSDTFIDYKAVKNKWNELQKKNGYLDDFYAKFGHWDCSSGTQVKAVKDMEDMPGYLKKEIMKGYQNQKALGGKVWDCSLNLKKAVYYTTFMEYEYSAKLYELEKQKKVEKIITEKCIIYKLIKEPGHIVLNERDKLEYSELMHSIRTRNIIPERKLTVELPQKIPPKPAPLDLFSRW